jgi:hypothetical protein
VGKIFLAGEEAEEGAALLGDVVADCALQHGIAGFEGVEDGADRDGAFDFERDFSWDLRECAQMRGKDDMDHSKDPALKRRINGEFFSGALKRSFPRMNAGAPAERQ